MVLAIVALVIVVARALLWDAAVIDTFVEVSAVDTDVLIIVSNVAVDLWVDSLTDIIRGVLTNIDVDVLMDANIKVFVDVMTAFEVSIPGPLEEFSR